MERKERLATFSSNERWFVARLGRDVWKHGVLEFLLPARRIQFKRAWLLGVIWFHFTVHRLSLYGAKVDARNFLLTPLTWGRSINQCVLQTARAKVVNKRWNFISIKTVTRAPTLQHYIDLLHPPRYDNLLWVKAGSIQPFSLPTSDGL